MNSSAADSHHRHSTGLPIPLPFSIPLPAFFRPIAVVVALLLTMGGDPFARLLLSHSGPSAVAAAGEQCPQWVGDEIQLCVQPVAEFARTLNRQQTESHEQAVGGSSSSSAADFGTALQWPTKMGGHVFRELCRLINNFELCVDVYKEKCRRHITISLIEASYGFLCNEGYETFMASAECLMELDQQPTVKSCHDRTLREIEEANREQNGTVEAKLGRMCNALNYFSECVRSPIRRSCGLDAWRVIFRVLKDTSRTLMPMCHFDDFEEEEKLEKNNAVQAPPPGPSTSWERKMAESEEIGGGKQTTVGPWERWEEDRDGSEEEGEGADMEIEVDSSHHQIHYESHQSQQQNGVIRLWRPATSSLLLFHTLSTLTLLHIVLYKFQ